MSRRNEVAEFEGAESLAKAAKTLLYSDTLDAVVVHGLNKVFGATWKHASQYDVEANAENVETMYRCIPEFSKVDEIVAEWWAERFPSDGKLDAKLAYAARRITGTTVHEIGHRDRANHGVLTGSIRIDQNPAKRHYYVRRSDIPSIGPDGVDYAARQTLDRQVQAINRRHPLLGRRALTHIVQRPGDAILFANHPFPAMHGVVQRQAGDHFDPNAVVVGYHLKPEQLHPNAFDMSTLVAASQPQIAA